MGVPSGMEADSPRTADAEMLGMCELALALALALALELALLDSCRGASFWGSLGDIASTLVLLMLVYLIDWCNGR